MKKNSFVSGAIISCFGTLITGILCYLNRRLNVYGLPAGEYAFFYSVVSIIALISSVMLLGIPNATLFFVSDSISSGRKDLIPSILSFAYRYMFVMSAVITAVCVPIILFSDSYFEKYGISSLTTKMLLLLLPVPLILAGSQQILSGLKMFVTGAVVQIVNYSIVLIGNIFFQPLFGIDAVIISYVIGGWLFFVIVYFSIKRSWNYTFWQTTPKDISVKMRNKGVWLFVSSSGYICFSDLAPAVIFWVSSTAEAVKFQIALPIALIIRSMAVLSTVFVPFSSDFFRSGNFNALRKAADITMLSTVFLMILCFVVLFWGGEFITSILFGEKFISASKCVMILSEGFLLWNAARFFSDILNSMHKEKLSSVLTVGISVASALLFFVFGSLFGADGVAWGVLISCSIWALMSYIVLVRFLKNSATL